MSGVIALEDEIRRRWPGRQVAHGVDHKGPWARIGDITARGRPGVEDALKAALTKLEEGTT